MLVSENNFLLKNLVWFRSIHLSISSFIKQKWKHKLAELWTHPRQQDVECKAKCNNKNREYNKYFYEGLKYLQEHHHINPNLIKPVNKN